MEAGCELTYDYGSAGSAGGVSQEEHDDSVQPMRKSPRQSASVDITQVASDKPRSLGGVMPTETGVVGVPAVGGDDGHGDTLRRPCLCGSRRCRGVLPYNRAIL